jgi:DNA-binding MarR family transcriptional regulator
MSIATRPAEPAPKRAAARTIYLLKRAETTVRLRLEEVLRDLAVTPGQYTTMTLVRTHREVSSADLARQVGVTPQSMSEMIAVLERKGWIERGVVAENKRILRIGLSDTGQALIGLCDARAEAMEHALLRDLAPDHLAALRRALEMIARG